MSDVSARLALPFILPSQAQKHVTHNEGMVRLDAIVQLVLEAIDATAPPGAPEAGQVWALGAATTGDWAGQGGDLAQWMNPGWAFITPQEGWAGWDRSAGNTRVFDGAEWVVNAPNQNLPGIGIGTSWDAFNALAVAGDATLLSHNGAGHQLKINKAGAGETASLLYQSGFTGHAEMGLAGNTNFSIKVSADGSAWSDAMVFDAATATVSGAAVQSAAGDVAPGKLARAEYTYGPGSLLGTVSESAGVPTGAVIDRGAGVNGEYVRFADGTQICTVSGATHTFQSNDSLRYSWTYPAAFAVGSIPVLSNTFSNSLSDFVDCNPRDIGIMQAGTGRTVASIDILRTRGAGAFGATSEVRNVRLMAVGRWF